MIINGLQTGEPKEQDGLPDGHPADGLGNGGAGRVEEEAFNWVVVERSERVRHVKPVVVRMEVTIEP